MKEDKFDVGGEGTKIVGGDIKIPNLVPELVNVEDLIIYEKNAKKHPRDQIEYLKVLIRKVGFREPVLLEARNDLVVVCGHGRRIAAIQLGMKQIPAVFAEDMTEQQIEEYRFGNNKVAQSGWDFDIVKMKFVEFREKGYDFELTGFDYEEIEDIMDFNLDEPKKEVDTTIKPKREIYITCPECDHTFVEKKIENGKSKI